MQNPTTGPAFAVYSLTTAALCLNLVGLWGYSGAVRGRTKTTPNAEDATTVSKGAEVTAADPPEVARVLRAHANATAAVVPHLILATVYVVLGMSMTEAWALLGGFVLARVLHSFAYLAKKQPWRTLSFIAGGLLTLALAVQVVRASIAML